MILLSFFFNVCILGGILWTFLNVGVPDFKDDIWILFLPAILASISTLLYYFLPSKSKV